MIRTITAVPKLSGSRDVSLVYQGIIIYLFMQFASMKSNRAFSSDYISVSATMPQLTQIHTHTFSDGRAYTKEKGMTFRDYDNADRERRSTTTFTNSRTGEIHKHTFVFTKDSINNDHTSSDDRDGEYDSDNIVRVDDYTAGNFQSTEYRVTTVRVRNDGCCIM